MKITNSQYGKILGDILELTDASSREKALGALAKVIIRNKDQKKFSKIVAMSEKLIDQKNRIVRGEVSLARKTSLEEEKVLAEFLNKKEALLQKKIHLEFKEDSSLLGGVKLKIGDELWDASWKRKMAVLAENLKEE